MIHSPGHSSAASTVVRPASRDAGDPVTVLGSVTAALDGQEAFEQLATLRVLAQWIDGATVVTQ
jgi:hypothetical protein